MFLVVLIVISMVLAYQFVVTSMNITQSLFENQYGMKPVVYRANKRIVTGMTEIYINVATYLLMFVKMMIIDKNPHQSQPAMRI
jgi:hypothetical protein